MFEVTGMTHGPVRHMSGMLNFYWSIEVHTYLIQNLNCSHLMNCSTQTPTNTASAIWEISTGPRWTSDELIDFGAHTVTMISIHCVCQILTAHRTHIALSPHALVAIKCNVPPTCTHTSPHMHRPSARQQHRAYGQVMC